MSVYAFSPRRGEFFFIAEDKEELAAKTGEEADGEQCDSCGSFSADGEPVAYTIGEGEVECQGCGHKYPVLLKVEDEVTF